MNRIIIAAALCLLASTITVADARDRSAKLRGEWPITDFSQGSVKLKEITSGGPPRDGIRSIDNPVFVPVMLAKDITDTEPVISVLLGGEARAYTFSILMQHEIVNDWVGGLPVAITYCPLCNSAVAFDRHVAGEAAEFGTTGRLYLSNLVMYDRNTESWWAQFTGEAIIGSMTGTRLKRLPSRIESFAKFRDRHPDGEVLAPPGSPRGRPYGMTPYVKYDSRKRPWFSVGGLPKNIPAMARVVSVGDRAWALTLVREKGRLKTEDGLIITWQPGQNSAMDKAVIAKGRDVGNVLVQQQTPDGPIDIPYGVDFAFAFQAFHAEATIITE